MTGYQLDGQLSRTDFGAAVTRLREDLIKAGISQPYLAAQSVERPEYFDDHVDAAVRAFQQKRGLLVDGIVGAETLAALEDAQFKHGSRQLSYQANGKMLRGDDVAELQRQLSHLGFYYGHLDGSFGYRTKLAVSELQSSLGLEATGIYDDPTMRAMSRVSRSLTSSNAFALRDYERLEYTNTALRGRVIALNPETRNRTTVLAGETLTDQELITDLLVRITATLTDLEAVVIDYSNTPETDRKINRKLLDNGPVPSILLNFGIDWLPTPQASGIASFYWGNSTDQHIKSPIGERAAGIFQRELVARTGMLDLGSHPRNWEVLKLAHVPCVSLYIGYLSNIDDAAQWTVDTFRQSVAEAIVVGIQRVFLLENDEPTGTLHVDDVYNYNSFS